MHFLATQPGLPVPYHLQTLEKDLDQTAAELALTYNKIREINDEIDCFTYGVSYDLRVLIFSLLDLINKSVEGCKAPETLDTIHDAILKLDNFIQSIARYSRSAPQYEEIDFARIINETYSLLRIVPRAKPLEELVELNLHLPFYSNEMKLKILLNNLILNALKVINKRQENPYVKITVTTLNRLCIIQVKDNGVGSELPPGTGNNKRVNEPVSALYIASEIARNMKGQLLTSSSPDNDTVVSIFLPCSSSKQTIYRHVHRTA